MTVVFRKKPSESKEEDTLTSLLAMVMTEFNEIRANHDSSRRTVIILIRGHESHRQWPVLLRCVVNVHSPIHIGEAVPVFNEITSIRRFPGQGLSKLLECERIGRGPANAMQKPVTRKVGFRVSVCF